MNLICIIFSLIIGACFGSFISLVSYRLPNNEDIFFKFSYCDNCKKSLNFFSLIPIFSYFFQNGKCYNCKKKISIRYPLIEIISSILFLISYLKFQISLNTIIINLIISTLFIMIITDLENYIIFNSIQIVLLILNIIFIYINYIDFFYSIYSSFIYFIIIYFVSFFVKKYKNKDSIGFGDIKLITIMGLLLGYKNIHIFFFLSGLFGTIFGILWKKFKKNEYFPFAPSLILSYLLIIFLYF